MTALKCTKKKYLTVCSDLPNRHCIYLISLCLCLKDSSLLSQTVAWNPMLRNQARSYYNVLSPKHDQTYKSKSNIKSTAPPQS